jgi:hypothetical protein
MIRRQLMLHPLPTCGGGRGWGRGPDELVVALAT